MAQQTAHVWVRKPRATESWPGLIMARQQRADGTWEAWVRYVEEVDDRELVVEEWLPYACLTPVAGSRPGIGSAYG